MFNVLVVAPFTPD